MGAADGFHNSFCAEAIVFPQADCNGIFMEAITHLMRCCESCSFCEVSLFKTKRKAKRPFAIQSRACVETDKRPTMARMTA